MLKLVLEMTYFNSETCLTAGGQIFKYSFKLLSRNIWHCMLDEVASA